MDDQVIISRTKLEALESDSSKYRNEMSAERDRLVKEYQLELEMIKEGAIILNPESWQPTYIFSKDKLVVSLTNENKSLRERNKALQECEAKYYAIEWEIKAHNNLPWYKRIFKIQWKQKN